MARAFDFKIHSALLTCFLVAALPVESLAEPIPIGGQIQADGRPAKGATVYLLPELGRHATDESIWRDAAAPEPEAQVVADAEGRFLLEAPAVGFWKVRLELDGHVAREIELEPLLHPTELGTLELDPDVGLEVRVRSRRPTAARVAALPLDPAATRFLGRRVQAQEPGNGSRPLATGHTDETGALRLPASGEEAAWWVEVTAKGFVPAQRQVSGRSRRVEIELEPGIERQIETVDGRGKPLEGVLIYLEDGALALGQTDDQGRVALVAPANGDLKLTALGRDGHHGTLRLEPPSKSSGQDLPVATFRLEALGTLNGRVIEDGSSEPIQGALVWFGSGAEAVISDAQGGYQVRQPPIPAGTRRNYLKAAAAGYIANAGQVTASDDTGPTIALLPAARLSGRVVDADGMALVGVEIGISVKRDGRRFRFFSPMARGQNQTRSRSDGRFEVPAVASGQSYELRLTHPGFAPGKLVVDDLKPFERRTDLEAVLERGRRAVGWVVDEDDLPVAGAEVRLAPPTDSRRRAFRPPTAIDPQGAETTDADGRFQIPDLAAGRYDLEAEASGFGSVTIPGVEVPAGAGEVDLGTVILPPGVAIEGRVVDTREQPIPGAEIRTSKSTGRTLPAGLQQMLLARLEPEAISDVDGRFRVPDRRAGERLDLIVAAGPGYVAQTLAGVVAPPEEPLRIVLQQSARVTGRVVDADGDPVEAATVQASSEGLAGSGARRPGPGRATSEADGRFELDGVEPGPITLVASADGFPETRLSGLLAPAGGELRDVELVLSPGAVLRGTVLEADGSPVAEAMVMVSATGGSRPEEFTHTDAEGRFKLDGARLGRRTVTAHDDGGRQVSKSLEVQSGSQSVELRFGDGVEVSGRVIDDTGLGIAGAVVSLRATDRRNFWGRAEGVSTEGGDFQFADVQPGTYRLQAVKEGFAEAQVETPIQVEASSIGGLEIRLSSGTVLSGRILGLEIDELAQVAVRAGRSAGQVDFEGGYRIENLSPGETTVSASIPGSGRQVTERITIEEGVGEQTLDLEFGGGYTLTGTVVAGDQPVTAASVHLFGLSGRGSGRGATDLEGRFRVEGLEAGSYRLRVSSFATGVAHSEEIELLSDDDVEIQIGSGRLAGRVRDAADSSALENVRLSLIAHGTAGTAGEASKTSTSDSQGYFSFGAVPEGRFRLLASKAGYAEAEQYITTRSGESVDDLDILLNAVEGLTFEVLSAAGVPPGRVEVALLNDAGLRIAGGGYQTLEGGGVEITTVPNGSWEMLIVAGDSATTSLRVTVPGDAGRIQLMAGGGIEAEVPELADGTVRALLRLVGPDGRPHRSVHWGGHVRAETTLRAGRATVSNLTPGSWTVTATTDDGRSWSATAVVTPGEPVAVTLR